MKIYPIQEAHQKVEEFLEVVDFNNDGTINFSEFVTVTIEKGRLLSEEMLRKAFNMFDIVRKLNFIIACYNNLFINI
jgi:Ca2+-binding EF-hand superfamily protein